MWECISEAAEDLSFSFSSILGWPTGFWPFKLTSSYFQNRQWYFKVDYSILSTAADGPAPFWAPPTVHQSSTLPLPLHPLWAWQITVSVITTNCFIFNHSREIYFHIECGWEVGKEKFSALVWLHEGFGCIQLFSTVCRFNQTKAWWYREFKAEYLFPLTWDDQRLEEYLNKLNYLSPVSNSTLTKVSHFYLFALSISHSFLILPCPPPLSWRCWQSWGCTAIKFLPLSSCGGSFSPESYWLWACSYSFLTDWEKRHLLTHLLSELGWWYTYICDSHM